MYVERPPPNDQGDFPWPDGFWAKLGTLALMIFIAIVLVLPMAYFFD